MSGRAAGASLTDEALLKGINESLKTAADGKANFTVSPEEADRVKQAFEKKEFRDMFREYLEEISDPKAREVCQGGDGVSLTFQAYIGRRSKRSTCSSSRKKTVYQMI